MAHKNIDVEKLLGLFTVNPNDARGKLLIAAAINDDLFREFMEAAYWSGDKDTELEAFNNSVHIYLKLENNGRKMFGQSKLNQSVKYLYTKVKPEVRRRIIRNMSVEYKGAVTVRKNGGTPKLLDDASLNGIHSDSDSFTVSVNSAGIAIPGEYQAVLDSLTSLDGLNKEDVQRAIREDPKLRFTAFNLSGNIYFSFKVSRFWLNKVFGSTIGSTGISESEIMEELNASDSNVSEGSRYTWRDGKLFDKEKGVEVEKDAKSKRHDDRCFDFGLAKNYSVGDRANACLHLIRDCIAGHNVNKCKDLLTTKDFWDFNKDEFKNMNIALAKKLLDAFQFNDTNGVYESPTKWMERISEWKSKYNLESADIDKVKENTNLIFFLDRVVEELNSNTVASNNPESSTLQDNHLWKMGIFPKVHMGGISLDEINRLIKSNRARIRSFFINPIGMAPMMIGGGNESMSNYALRSAQIKKEFKSSFDQLDSMRQQFMNVIEAHDHKIDDNEVKAIDSLYKKLSKGTNSFLKYLDYMEKYAVLHSFYSEHDPDKIIDVRGMKAFVDKRDSKFNDLEKVEDNVMEVLKALQNAVDQLKK